jgi:DNA mismatch endonuclease, patch repair protein
VSDVFTREKRSAVMARIRGRGNKDTELALAAFFRKHKFSGWRRHRPMIGRPDFVFSKQKVAVFTDGCFWHGCPKHFNAPVQNSDFWEIKIGTNRIRDRRVTRELRRQGWRVLRIWEHELAPKNREKLLAKVSRYLAPKVSS